MVNVCILVTAIIFSTVTTMLITINCYRKRSDMGNLIVSSNPNEEFMSLELTKKPDEILKRRYIFLWVKHK